jgi:hypothetical protein
VGLLLGSTLDRSAGRFKHVFERGVSEERSGAGGGFEHLFAQVLDLFEHVL